MRGSHLVFPRLTRSNYAIAYFEAGGRIVFFVPWGTERRFTLVGTTDIDHQGGPDDVRISPDEIRYLKDVVRQVLRSESLPEPVSAFSSLRPLVADPTRPATAVSRRHRAAWRAPRPAPIR